MNPNCKECNLHETCLNPFMKADSTGYYPDSDTILIFGEAPGKEEDRKSTPFIGRSGQLLRDIVEETGLNDFSVVYTNVVKCRPLNNKTPSAKQIRLCKPFLEAELETYKPRIIMLLGNTPLKALLGESGITNWRGVIVRREDAIYVPTFHPAFILRNPTSINYTIADFESVYNTLHEVGDVKGVDANYDIKVLQASTEKLAEEGSQVRKSINNFLTDMRNADYISFDTEVTSLRSYDDDQKIILMSFAVDSPLKCVAWTVNPSDERIRDACVEILTDKTIKKIGHNVKFDALSVLGIEDIWVEGIVGDTMLLSHTLDSQPGRHGLKMLASRHLEMHDYDRKLKDFIAQNPEANPKKGGTYENVPGWMLTEYASMDAIATLELHGRLYEELNDTQKVLYEQLLIPASAALTEMESNGCLIDFDVVAELIELYSAKKEEQLEHLRVDRLIQQYTSFRRQGNTKFEFNPNSSQQMRTILFDAAYYNLKPTGFTDTGLPSTEWKLIKKYVKDVPMLEDYRYFKLCAKMLSTYLKPTYDQVYPDGKVRSSYLIHGTVTGRLASRQPNLQNIPSPEKEPGTILATYPIRDIYTYSHDEGHLLNVDYSGMELRVMAALSDCDGLINAFAEDKDPHSLVVCQLHNLEYNTFIAQLKSGSLEAKAKRRNAKAFSFALLYGGSEYTIHHEYGLSMHDARKQMQLYYELFPELLIYKKRLLTLTKENGYVTSPFGRIRYLPYINEDGSYGKKAEREAVNMPTQSGAGDLLLCSLIVLTDLLYEEGYQSALINTVYDSILLDIAPGELNDVAVLCEDVMENITGEYGEEWFPGLDFSWMTVPLKVDLEYGDYYGSLEKYEVT